MKILNRPMFRMGGPIKEGIMNNIKEPRQGYQQSGMVFPGDVNRMMPNASKVFADFSKNYMPSASINQTSMIPEPAVGKSDTSYNTGNFGSQETDVNLDTPPRIKVPKYIADNDGDGIRDLNPKWEKANWLEKNVFGVSEEQVEPGLHTPSDINIRKDAIGMPHHLTQDTGASTIDKVLDNKGLDDGTGNGDGGREKNVKSILEKLGYARSQKNALYDALIKGGQRIAREGLGKEGLVADLIADTSTSYDKPEKIREAAELMQVQQDLKLEGIREGKSGGARQQDYDYYINQGDSPALAKQKADGVATTIVAMKERAKKMGDGQGDAQVESVAQQMVDGNWFPDRDYKGTISGKKYDNITEFVESAEFKSEGKGAGIYVVKGKVIELDENGKMIFDKVVTSSTSNSKWWNPLD